MLKNVIDNLIPTGVMKYLVENFYTKKRRFEKFVAGPEVLTFNDLQFGFNIWFGSILLALLAFCCESFARLKRRTRKVNHAKLQPLKRSLERTSTKLTADLIGKFRKIQSCEEDNGEQ